MENTEKLPMMGFMDSIKTVFGSFLTSTEGHAARNCGGRIWPSWSQVALCSNVLPTRG